jgi:maleylpyruvate isomerase
VKLRLFNYWRSSASHRVRIALNLKGLPYEYIAISLIADGGQQKTAAYRAKNPMQQLPTLELTDDDGAVHDLVQSLPILEFLDERFPEPPLLPKDPYARAQARGLAELINSGIQPLQNLSTTRKIKALGGDDQAFAREFIELGLRAFAAQAARSAGRFCVGDAPTIADCCLVPQMHSARRFGASLDGLDLLVRISDECERLPAFASAAPAAQPDATPA